MSIFAQHLTLYLPFLKWKPDVFIIERSEKYCKEVCVCVPVLLHLQRLVWACKEEC